MPLYELLLSIHSQKQGKLNKDSDSLSKVTWGFIPGKECFWLVQENFPGSKTKQKHYPDLGSDMSPVRNFSSDRLSDVIDSVESKDVGCFLRLSIIIDNTALRLTFSVNT